MLKKVLILILVLPKFISAQNYVGLGDSCFKIKNYTCAGSYYDLYLKNDSSNGIAYRSLLAWCMAKNKEKAFFALHTYIQNNYANGVIVFSKQLENDSMLTLLKVDHRWMNAMVDVRLKERMYVESEQHKIDSALRIQKDLETFSNSKQINFKNKSAQAVYGEIKGYNLFPPIRQRYISMQFQITDSLHTAFLIVIPRNYNPKRSYPLLFSLHGAVSSNIGYPDIILPEDTSGWNRYYTKYARDVIMVYPHSNNVFNWMYPDQGFFMVPEILNKIKQIININDNRVFVTGHSNGATGSFSYLLKQPSPFAAFYGFNTRPRIETGGTYIKNIVNRSFINISTDHDYYYPPLANDSLSALMKLIGADYHDQRYNGFPHWFPQFDESELAHKLIFSDLAKRNRNPFHPILFWECDTVQYGECDWIQVTGLDTVAKPATWHTTLNFTINKWVESTSNNKFIVRDTLLQAFNNVKKSGAIRVQYKQNTFNVETSRIKTFSILLSPEMINFRKRITVIVNGKVYKRQMVFYNMAFLKQSYLKNRDRVAIWVNKIDIKVPN